MGSFTPYGRKLLLDSLFITGATLGSVWVALTVVVPGTVDDAARLVEPREGDYARAPYSAGWTAGQPGEVLSAGVVTFPQPTGRWGTVRGWALVSAATDGNVIAVGAFTVPKTVTSVMTPPTIAAGGLKVMMR